MTLSSNMQMFAALVREAKDTPEPRFVKTEYCPCGQMYEVKEILRDEHGQAYRQVLIHPDDVERVRGVLLPHAHPLAGLLKGLE